MKRLYFYTQAIACDSNGAATVYFGQKIHGKVLAIVYTPGTIDTNGDLVFTGETTGVAILTKANAGTAVVTYYPIGLGNLNTNGAAMTDFGVPIPVVSERIKLVVAQGGNLGAGSCTILTEEYTGKY